MRSATFPNGLKHGCVTVTPVHADKMPKVPNFGQQPRVAVTIQPAGTLFDPPAPISFPNADGLPPGQKTDMYSYDHDLEQFVSVGTGTVSEDGLVIRSDPGLGVIKAGWHCGGNPATGVCLHQCPTCQYRKDPPCTDELLRGVDIALGQPLLSACRSVDRDRDGAVTVDEIVAAANAALVGCPPTATPASTATATVTVSPTATPSVTMIPSATPTLMPSSTPTATSSATPIATPAPSATATPSVTPTLSPTPTALATPTASETATASVTPTATATSTPTPTMINQPPVVPDFGVYEAYPGYEIRLPIAATDPDGDQLQYAASSLPDGAALDASTGIFSWTPRADQLGPAYVPFTTVDDGIPPLSVQGLLTFEVGALDACTVPSCDPATGCAIALAPIQTNCCVQPAVRVAEPLALCPGGRALYIGRNNVGFGRLYNCDQLRVINFLQAGASVRFNVQARCVNVQQVVNLHARPETQTRLVLNQDQLAILQPQDDGYAERLSVIFPVLGPSPFFDLEGAEALLTVTLTDADGTMIEELLRLQLTFDTLNDLPEIQDVPPPAQ